MVGAEKHIVKQTNRHCGVTGAGAVSGAGGRSLNERSPIEIIASNADDY